MWMPSIRPKAPMALEDAQRTVGLVRFHATEYHVDPHKIGVLGFSAGGHLVTDISTHFDRRLYPAVDAADTESCRPDFGVFSVKVQKGRPLARIRRPRSQLTG